MDSPIRPGGDADGRPERAIRAAGVVVEQHLVDDVEVALACQDVDFLEIRRLLDAILDLEVAVVLLVDLEDVALERLDLKVVLGFREVGARPRSRTAGRREFSSQCRRLAP